MSWKVSVLLHDGAFGEERRLTGLPVVLRAPSRLTESLGGSECRLCALADVRSLMLLRASQGRRGQRFVSAVEYS